MTKPAKPIKAPPAGLRQRWRARTSDWRVWWEPNATQRAAGFEAVELDGTRPTWSVREAEKLNRQASGPARTTAPAATAAGNSIDAVCVSYMASPRFYNLRPKTQQEYRKDIARILEKWQGSDMRKLTKPVVHNWYEALYDEHGRSVSRRLIKMLSILMSYAELKGVIYANPLHRMQMITPRPRQRTVAWHEFDALEAAAIDAGDEDMRLALYLGMFQGQRVTDVYSARAADFVSYEDGTLVWRIVRSKDSQLERLNYLVIHPDVRPHLERAIATAQDPRARIIKRLDGAHYADTTFPYAFAKIRKAAAEACPSVADIQFRDLRRTFSDNARHANIPSDDVDDALGNTAGTDARLRQVYMPQSDARAAEAILSIERPRTSLNFKTRRRA
ncbi:MAG: hypothetical protein AAFO97_15075 [Pseudomonadota bacterium]